MEGQPKVSIQTTPTSEGPEPDPLKCQGPCGKTFSAMFLRVFAQGLWLYPSFDQHRMICHACAELLERQGYLKAIARNLEAHLRFASIPPKYFDASFDSFQPPNDSAGRILEICKTYATAPTGSLFIYGPCGSGKTHLATAILRQHILNGREGRFAYVLKVLLEIQESFRDETKPSQLEIISEYNLPKKLLILDDFGVEKSTEWARQTLDFIITERDANNLPTVITSNLSPDELAEKTDSRISSRLSGMGKILPLKAPDYRTCRPKKSPGPARERG